MPNDITGAQKSSDADHELKATLDDYTVNVPDMSVNFVIGETSSAKINWVFINTRFDEEWGVSFPTKANESGDIASDLLPTVDDFWSIGIKSSNMKTETALNTFFRNSTENMDGLHTAFVRFSF
jgi:hypothetical protein